MRWPSLLFVSIFCLTAHAEKSIYKCPGPNESTIFSPTPCGKNAKEVNVSKATSLSTPPSNDAIRDISDNVSDIHCRDDARKLYIEPDTSAIVRAEAAIRDTQHRAWYSESNPAQAQQMASDDATRVVSWRNVIATEQARVDTQRAESRKRVDEALTRCEDDKRRRDDQRGK